MKTNEDAFENDDDIDEMEEDSSIDDEAAELDKWEDEGSEEQGSASGSRRSVTAGNGYGALVRLGRSRGWVTVEEINDHLPESAVRTAENVQEITEALGRLSIKVFETRPDEDDLLITGNGVDEAEDIDEDELRDISGRARFLIRKLGSKGWFEKERGTDFREYITVPGCSSRLLELFHALREDTPARGYSYVFGTYSTLKVAHESDNVYDKMAAVYGAYDNTRALINLLQMVYHNVKHYFQMQIDMHNVGEVLASHFDDFGQKVMEAYIRPLKIKDSVPKYRISIQNVLNDWAENDELLIAMANAALADRRGDTTENCRADLLRKIYWIQECYDNLERDYLDEIDAQVRRYTRAATQKIENLTNRDQNIRGNLHTVLTALSRNRRAADLVDTIQPVFRLYEQTCLSESRRKGGCTFALGVWPRRHRGVCAGLAR